MKLPGPGFGGLSASDRIVIASARDGLDSHDLFIAVDLETGRPVWQIRHAANGNLDYGNAPRATPLIAGELTVLLGAFGDLHCVRTSSGRQVWTRSLQRDFGAPLPTWGFCGSPLVLGDRLYLQAGSKQAGLLCLDLNSGAELWRSEGHGVSYSSMVAVEQDGRTILVGYDDRSLGGWDAATGERLWTHVPGQGGDFNVPTPLVRDGRIWLATENNGTRRHLLEPLARPAREPAARSDELAPDTQTPLLLGDRLFGIWNGLHCLDAETLETLWLRDGDEALTDYAAMIGCGSRVLLFCRNGELILIDATAPEYRELGRWRIADEDCEVQSYPALSGSRLVVRLANELVCLELGGAGADQ